ncbi:MAG: periplasmic heavy metal sensor [Ignavibacteriae bacterium]|nr:periplasmic heavy metal sensor [Ignavibacteriota bacterium]
MKKILVLFVLTTAFVFAQPRWMDDDDFGPPTGHKPFIDRLHLTEEQEEQFDKFRSEFQKKNIELRAKVQTMRLTLRDLFDEDKPDQGNIESVISDISKVQNEMKLNAISHWFKVNKILQPEQQELWKEHRVMMKKHMGQRQGFGHGKRMNRGHGQGQHGLDVKHGCRGNCCD